MPRAPARSRPRSRRGATVGVDRGGRRGRCRSAAAGRVRESVLGLLGGAVEDEAEVVARPRAEGGRGGRARGLAAQVDQQRERAARLQQRDVVPALEVRVEPAGTGRTSAEERLTNSAPRPSAASRSWRTSLRVEGVARDVDARRREDLDARAPGPTREHREVAGAAAEVADQHQLVALEPASRSGARPRPARSSKRTSSEAGVHERRRGDARGRALVLVALGADEAHRAADHDARRTEPAELAPRPPRAAAEQRADQIARARSCGRRSPSPKEPAREERLHRLDQPPACARVSR